MKREHAAIIAKARRDGLKPVELAHELMGYTLIEAMRDASASQSIAFSKMSEVQQDSCIQQWTEATKEAIDLAIQVIASAGTRTVRMDLTSVAVGKKLKVVGVVAGTEEYKHDLIDLANDQGTAIVILNERDYLQGLDGIKGEKDQKSLPIDEDEAPKDLLKKPAAAGKRASAATGSATSAAALAKTATTLPPKLLEDARTFLRDQQSVTVSGTQNHLKIGGVKAAAVLEELVAEGLAQLVEGSKPAQYTLVHESAPAGTANDSEASGASGGAFAPTGSGLTFDGDDDAQDRLADEPGTNEAPTILTDELFSKIKAQVLKTKKVSVGALSIAFDADDEIIEQAIQRLELEGVISEENEAGMRTINAAA